MKKPYEQFPKEKLILRDLLAIDRTILANERTLLSYVRTSLAIVVVGGTILHFLRNPSAFFAGISFIVVGLAMLFVGIRRFVAVRDDIEVLRKKESGSG